MPDAPSSPTVADRVRQLIAFPAKGESDAARLSRLLHAFLVMSGGISLAFLVVAGPTLNARARLLVVSLLVALGALSVLGRRGRTRLAALLYLGGLWLYLVVLMFGL